MQTSHSWELVNSACTSISSLVSGCEPKIMGIGPAYAIKTLLEKTGVKMEDVDLFEVSRSSSFPSIDQ